QSFYITTKDGTIHHIANNGNIYLIIDGDSFETKYNWLSKWDFIGTSNVPDGFWGRVESRDSYELMDDSTDYQNRDNTDSHIRTDGGDNNPEIADVIVIDHIDEENDTNIIDPMPGFTEEEVVAGQAVVEEYFRAIEVKDDESILKTMTPMYSQPNTVLYDEETRSLLSIEYIEDDPFRKSYVEYGRGRLNGTKIEDVIVFKVSFNVKYPEGVFGVYNEGDYTNWSMILIREDNESPWLIDDQGY
ncbi:MAG: DUF4829 domain-containing protein, partial [Anaerolineaceae bacterium]